MLTISLIQNVFIDLQLSTQRGVRCFGVQRQFWDVDDFRSDLSS